MNEEEKKAVEIVNSLKEWGKIHFIVKDRCHAKLTYNEVYLLLALIEKLQKENEELKEYLITQNCEINRLNLAKIRLELSQVPDTTEQYKYLKNEYKMRLERTDLENYKSNYISIQKVKDKIEYLDNQQKQWLEDRKLKVSDSEIIFARDVLQELLEGRK